MTRNHTPSIKVSEAALFLYSSDDHLLLILGLFTIRFAAANVADFA